MHQRMGPIRVGWLALIISQGWSSIRMKRPRKHGPRPYPRWAFPTILLIWDRRHGVRPNSGPLFGLTGGWVTRGKTLTGSHRTSLTGPVGPAAFIKASPSLFRPRIFPV